MRGQHAGAVNATLRSQLAEAVEARRRLEQRLTSAERERDELRGWKRDAQRNGNPEVRAERKRADDLELRLTIAADETARHARDRCDEVLAICHDVMKRAGVGAERFRFYVDQLERLSELCDPKALHEFYYSDNPSANRQRIRDMARMPRWAKAALNGDD